MFAGAARAKVRHSPPPRCNKRSALPTHFPSPLSKQPPARKALREKLDQAYDWSTDLVVARLLEVAGEPLLSAGGCVAFDVRQNYQDPGAGHSGLSRHCGWHAEIALGLTRSEAFTADLNALLRILLERVAASDEAQPIINVAFVCRSGKHRSVGWAYLVFEALRTDPDFYTTGPPFQCTHLADACSCGAGACCRQQNCDRACAIVAARRAWSAVRVFHGLPALPFVVQ